MDETLSVSHYLSLLALKGRNLGDFNDDLVLCIDEGSMSHLNLSI